MTTVEVFDPALCCSTGVCGTDANNNLVRIAADLQWLAAQGVEVKRHNLAQEPQAFVNHEQVKAALREDGENALPLVLVDGKLVVRGAYPSREQLAAWTKKPISLPQAAGGSCCGTSGCC